VTDPSVAEGLARRLTGALAAPLPTEAGPQSVGISVGVVLVEPSDTPEGALCAADAAMYEVKRRRR
jgi:GGDEF domain-containing protein